VIDSSAGECKTVVLKFDAAIFSTVKLKVTLADENGNALTISEADDLEDVLDPCNDGEQGFEYWIVVDKYGTQVILSFAHFSEKRVSVEAAAVSNIAVPGVGLGAVVAALAAVATVSGWARRRFPR
ncbi:MAG: hypothetical protein HYT80_04595, partial [Euryarchaeota archaeon]|nr:hypothetical protein [Euryarchaeota archaeon]